MAQSGLKKTKVRYEGTEYVEEPVTTEASTRFPTILLWLFYPILLYTLLAGILEPGSLFYYLTAFFAIILALLPPTILNLTDPERAALYRTGKFRRIIGPGWYFPLITFLDYETIKLVDIRMEQIIIEPQPVVTKDKIWFQIAPTIFLYVSNAEKAIRNVQDYKKAVVDYVVAALTSICGAQTSDYIVTHMDKISRDLEEGVAKLASVPGREWGVEVPRVEIKSIEFPDKVQDAMHDRVAAEQKKLAAHEQAEASKVVIDAVREAGAKLTDPAITYLYLEALDKMAQGRATKIIMPMEISKIAERITKTTGGLTPNQSNQLHGALETYEDKLKKLEGEVEEKEKELEELEKTQETTSSKEKPGEEDYAKKIEEIKKRIKGMEK
ncbi:MAG: hypothetical protein L6243_01045 [Candidatus Altiarchaeales archaeon]|nr:hypothetical protein [Candidatus Altiarchaeota archaeon]MBU4341433.1 hypothetical protein [Candidatus Altiarchaeota archaeon]MBU4436746.1 hypothetical protein [Candidatus Altiarchaeota archaeon]MCG2782157.1 hypothetical protein [Candidatus Altiarchaeales archaeon]